MPNRLINETSPYLQQHAHNPVDWYPWGQEALAAAQERDAPIFLSIGYSSCHWCHVMERESFENQDTAKLLNENFVSIKVDREERPDIDSVYMDAVQALSGHGGWPLSVFLTPDGSPFFGGTYYPPEDRPGMPGFPRVLTTVLDAYTARKSEIKQAGQNIVDHLRRATVASSGQDSLLSKDLFTEAFSQLSSTFDAANGGFMAAPKFPQPMLLEFLMRYISANDGDSNARAILETTLEHMAAGGLYDQLGGGFHRYSTDAQWLVPHFEKMLYDNALLVGVYLHAWQLTKRDDFRRVVEETVDFLLREMLSPEGGFYSTLDADSEGEEGRFYVWTPAEISAELSDESAAGLFCDAYGVTESGNFENSGSSVLNSAASDDELAMRHSVSVDDVRESLAHSRQALLEAREARVRPFRDEKILTGWNGLLLRAIAETAGALGRDDYRDAAEKQAAFLVETMRTPEGRLLRTWKDGEARILAYLEDHANLANGLLSLFELTFDRRWLDEAVSLADSIIELFWDDEASIFYDIGSDAESLVVRPRTVLDNATPSGGASAAEALLRLHALTGNGNYHAIAERALRSVHMYMERYPTAVGHWLAALDFAIGSTKEIALIGNRAADDMGELLDALNTRFMPNKIVVAATPDEAFEWGDLPVLEGRSMINDKATAYVCENYICMLPVTTVEAFLEQLDAPPPTVQFLAP